MTSDTTVCLHSAIVHLQSVFIIFSSFLKLCWLKMHNTSTNQQTVDAVIIFFEGLWLRSVSLPFSTHSFKISFNPAIKQTYSTPLPLSFLSFVFGSLYNALNSQHQTNPSRVSAKSISTEVSLMSQEHLNVSWVSALYFFSEPRCRLLSECSQHLLSLKPHLTTS